MTTLVTFLGLGKTDSKTGQKIYDEVTYVAPDSDNRRVTTRYVARALAEFFSCENVHVVATELAWGTHGDRLAEALSELDILPAPHIIPEGKDEKELRQQFRVLRDVLAEPTDELVLDITHGFRHQPFFAASALSILQAAGDLPLDTRIVYGAFEAGNKEKATAPILDISHFIDLMGIAFGVSIFINTGHAGTLIDALKKESARLAWRKQKGERDSYDETRNLINALNDFHDDLSTLRLPHLISDANDRSSASRFLEAIERYGKFCDKAHPALVPLIDRLQKLVEPLAIPDFTSSQRPEAMRHLAQSFLKFSRYLEAAAVAREEIVNRFAAGDALEAGTPYFDNNSRRYAEKLATDIQEIRNHFDFRNDLLHCGMRHMPIPARKLKSNVEKLVNFMEAVSARKPRTIFVTRHAGAREWAERQGIIVDEMVEHLDPETINPGDLVIGTLPVHLVAEICRRGGRYKHLSMNIPPEHRGRELSADDMEKFGARLEEFIVSTPKDDKKEP